MSLLMLFRRRPQDEVLTLAAPPLESLEYLAMSSFRTNVALPDTLVNIGVGSRESIGGSIGQTAAGTSAVWPAQNRAILVPFRLSSPLTVVKAAIFNGAAVSGNFDIGIYDAAFTQLVAKGATAQSGTSQVQEVDLTDTLLGAGLFYLALAFDNTTATTTRQAIPATIMQVMGCCQMAAAYPLPATVTPAAVASAYLPLMMLTGRTTV